MRFIVACLIICTIAYEFSDALKCIPCDGEKRCQNDLSSCQWGISKDACQCCNVCSKGPQESCGGAFNMGGSCGTNLVCEANKTSSNYPGRCIDATDTKT